MTNAVATTPTPGPVPAEPESTGTPRPALHPVAKLLGMTAGLVVVLALLLLVFIMPSLKSGPHDLALGIVGEPAAAAHLGQALEAAAPGAFVPEGFDSEGRLRDAILNREVIGGLIVSDAETRALVAGGGSTAISGAVSAAAEAVAAASGATVAVEDLVPLPEADPSGIGIGGLAFPLVFGGIVPVAAMMALFPRRPSWRLAGAGLFALVGGLAVAGVLQYVFGSIEGAFWPVAGAIALGIAGLAVPLLGLQAAFGAKGFTIGAMAMMFLGNPLAGIATTAAWLPTGLGLFGQLLPPGAAGTLVRSAAYFGGAGGLAAGLTLAAWVLVGIALLGLAARRTARAQAVPAL